MTKPMTLTDLKKELKTLNHAELVDLVLNLYKANGKTKELINTRFIGEKYQEDALEAYKKKMNDEFFPKNMRKMPSLKAAKLLITEFKKIGSFEMVLDLMLCFVECGTEFTNDFGDINGPFYDSLCTVFDQFVDQLNQKGTEDLYLKFQKRIDDLVFTSSNIGWGYGDFILNKSFEIEWSLEDE